MRKLVMAMMVLGAAGQAFALAPLGPPMATLDRGKMSLGFDFADSEMNIKWTGFGVSETLEDVDTQVYMANLGLGLDDNWEIFVRLGTADHEMGGYQGSSGFAYGFGTKVTLSDSDPLSWCALFQMTWSESSDTLSMDIPPYGTIDADFDIDIIEIKIAIGPTYRKDNFSLYGGPFLHLIDGDIDISALGDTGSFDLKQKSEFGGYVGAQFDLAESSSLFIEYQMTGDASAIAGGIVWRF